MELHTIRRERWRAIIKECNESGMSKKGMVCLT